MSQTGTKDSRTDVPLTHLGNRWAGTFSPGWSYQPGLKVSLVPGAKNIGTKAKFRSGSKIVSLLVTAYPSYAACLNLVGNLLPLARDAELTRPKLMLPAPVGSIPSKLQRDANLSSCCTHALARMQSVLGTKTSPISLRLGSTRWGLGTETMR